MKYFILVCSIFCFVSLYAQENIKYVNVNGTSELILPADQVEMTVQIKTIESSVEGSKKINDKYLDKLMGNLKGIGFTSGDIEVSPVIIGKNYEYEAPGGRKQKGFFTEVKISFTLKDLSKYYELTNRIASENNFEIISSSYSVSDYEVQHRLAYEKALNAAKEKAVYMTKALGVNLGEVLEIEENSSWQSYASPFNNVSEVNSQTGNISGKVTIKRSVRVKFGIN